MSKRMAGWAAALIVCGMAAGTLAAGWEPNKAALDAALETGDFTDYYAKVTTWLNEKTPSATNTLTRAALLRLLKDPVFAKALAQRHILCKVGVAPISAGAKNAGENRAFLAWLLQNTEAMNLYLEGATPTGLGQREAGFGISPDSLKIWSKIWSTDPESREGLYLRLAIATGLNPPGTSTPGSGQSKKPLDPLVRYQNFRQAHKNGELFPTFDSLTVWDLRQVVCCNATDEDIKWGREMVRTWTPQLLAGERVVDTTGYVWRRNSPVPHNNYRDVLDGGGKCGPRSSWAVFICQANGIPATGVGQPAHACVAYRDMNGNWQVAYGRSWAASRLLGMSGNEFVESIKARYNQTQFSQIERLRWLASALNNPGQANAVHAIRQQIAKSSPEMDVPPRVGEPKTSKLTALEGPENDGDGYTARMCGYVHPPKTGEYQFAVSADDMADLYVSTDDSPDNIKLVALLREATEPKKFAKVSSQRSGRINLEAGKKYYIEVLHRESKGNDHVSAAWVLPDGTQEVITGKYLSAYPDGAKGAVVREVWRDTVRPVKTNVVVEAPIKVAPGVIHIEAENFFDQGGITVWGGYPGVPVFDCYTGGKQIFFQGAMATAWVGYKINVPATGTYELTARIAVANGGQSLYARSFGAMATAVNATASHVYRNDQNLGAKKAVDNNIGTRWCVNEGNDQCWLELDLGQPTKISTCMIDERCWNRISKYNVAYKNGNDWKILFEGDNIGIDFCKDFDPVTAQYVRLNVFDTRAGMGWGATVWEFSVGEEKDGRAWIPAERTDGLWKVTKPADMRLVKGEQTLWVTAPFQRGVAVQWFELTPKKSGAIVDSVKPEKALQENTVEDEN